MKDEIFGPLLPVLSVPSVDAAVAYVNKVGYTIQVDYMYFSGLYVFKWIIFSWLYCGLSSVDGRSLTGFLTAPPRASLTAAVDNSRTAAHPLNANRRARPRDACGMLAPLYYAAAGAVP